MLKNNIASKSQEQVPVKLLSQNKKMNMKVERVYYRNKIRQERNNLSRLLHNFQPGYILPQYEGQQTLKVTQQDIANSTNIQTTSNMFELKLNMGSYHCNYSRNGSTLLLTSSMGHISILNWRQKSLILQLNLKEKILDSTFLHNDEMCCLSQKSGTYIYDNQGIELHRLKFSKGIEYLPYHFLLAAYDNLKLTYYDNTTGNIIADHIAKNQYTVMRQNKSNAIIGLGSTKGVVEWWTPGNGIPPVSIFIGGSVSDISFYKQYMITASESLKIWDTRTFKIVDQYPLHRKIKSMEISDSGLLAINYGFRMEFHKDWLQSFHHPYLHYRHPSINNALFVPFQDLMGLGTANGFTCIAVPGAGVPFYDTRQNNPFETKKQKRQQLVHKLLEKLPPQTITVDPNIIGNINPTQRQILEAQQIELQKQKDRERIMKTLQKKKMRGKNKISNKVNRKNIEFEKLKRKQLTKNINVKLWAKWAERKKRKSQLQLIQQMQQEGIGAADLLKKSKTKKIKKVYVEANEHIQPETYE